MIARAFMGLFGGTCECKQTWRKAKKNVSTGLKQLKIAEPEGGIERKKNIKM